MLKEFELNDYLFDMSASDLELKQRQVIEQHLKKEMREIFTGKNIN
jgi:S-adenosylmethionine decarboxylase